MRTAMSEDLEREVQALSAEIRRLDADAAAKKAAAEKLVRDIKQSGTDPLRDTDAFDRIDSAYKEADTVAEEASVLRQRRERGLEMFQGPAPRESAPAGIVEAFMASADYRELARTGAFMGENSRIEIGRIEVASPDVAVRALRAGKLFAATADAAAAVPLDQRFDILAPVPVRQPRIAQLVTVETTEAETVRYLQETTRTDPAAETAPGTAYPEATYVYATVDAIVQDIGQFTPAHKRQLADAGQLRALLEGRLQSGVLRRLDSQLLSGDGVGSNLKGILNTTGIGTQAKGTDSRLEAIHKAVTVVRTTWFDDPDYIGLHPTDYQSAVFEKGADGQYLLGPASQQTSRTMWGFPVAMTAAFTAGTGLVGAYKVGAALFVRSGIALSASDSHSTFFTERRVALLAEIRAAFTVPNPKAFVQVTGL